jgi:hypothetical protein
MNNLVLINLQNFLLLYKNEKKIGNKSIKLYSEVKQDRNCFSFSQ